MKMNRISVMTMALSCMPFAATSKAHCEGDMFPSVAFLTAFSEVIVVGTATAQNVTSTSATVDIEVERVLKGAVAVNTQIRVPFSSNSSACTVPQSAAAVTAVWFLKKSPDGALAFADSPKSQACHPFLSDYEMPAGVPPAQWSYPEDAKPEDKLAHELAWSIEAHQGDGPVALILNPNLLDGASKDEALRIYQALYASGTEDIHLAGMIGLLHSGDVGAMQSLADNVTQMVHASRRATYLRAGERLPIRYGRSAADSKQDVQTQETVIAAVVGRIANPSDDTVRQLGRLSEGTISSASIRRASARALSEIHTPMAVTYLAPLLYEDKDPALRAYAVTGLACFANAVPVLDPTQPNHQLNLNYSGTYKTDATLAHFAMGLRTISQKESYYLDFWRSWWSTNQAAIEATASSAIASEKTSP
jgi:hypothetical protein